MVHQQPNDDEPPGPVCKNRWRVGRHRRFRKASSGSHHGLTFLVVHLGGCTAAFESARPLATPQCDALARRTSRSPGNAKNQRQFLLSASHPWLNRPLETRWNRHAHTFLALDQGGCAGDTACAGYSRTASPHRCIRCAAHVNSFSQRRYPGGSKTRSETKPPLPRRHRRAPAEPVRDRTVRWHGVRL